MICHTSSSSYRNDLRIKTHTDNDTYHGSDPPAVRPSITRNISLRESPCGSSPMGVPHGSAVRDQKNRVLGTQSLDPTKAHIPPLTLVLSRVGSAQDHPPPTTLTTLQRLVVVPISAGPRTFISAKLRQSGRTTASCVPTEFGAGTRGASALVALRWPAGAV